MKGPFSKQENFFRLIKAYEAALKELSELTGESQSKIKKRHKIHVDDLEIPYVQPKVWSNH